MVSEVTSIDDDVISNASYTRQNSKRFINFLLKDVLGADQTEGKPQESISTMRWVEGCVQGAGMIKSNVPISASGVYDIEEFGSV